MSVYKSVNVSCMDLARILDWCDSSILETAAGTKIRIADDPNWYGEAYRNLSHDFRRQIDSGTPSDTHVSLVFSSPSARPPRRNRS